MKILAFAYACEPAEGSEPGAGWMWARMLARHGETWVITRSNNRDRIGPALAEVPERDRLHVEYVDLPAWARFWKRGTRGLRIYYLLWQLAALRRARRLHGAIGFDLVWHLTLANAWLGSAGALVGPPFVLGPVGGGVGPPWSLVWATGPRSAASELARSGGRALGRYLNPLARVAWARAQVILVQNPQTRQWLPARHRRRARVFPNVVLSTTSNGGRRSDERPKTALFAGRLIPWKGADLAIEAIGRADGWRLVVCGEGPDEPRLRGIAAGAGLRGRVEFRGRVPRPDLLRLMQEEAGVLLFPSLHDEAGWVLAEALAARLPVVCLNNGGPASLTGGFSVAVPTTGDRERVIERLAEALERARAMPMADAAEFATEYQIDRRAGMLPSVVGSLLGSGG